MTTPRSARAGADVAAPLLATATDPGALHAALREQGVHQRDGGWVIARPADVAAALACPALTVNPGQAKPTAPARGAARLRAVMARFTDGEDHARRRTLVEQLLPGADGLQDAAARRTTAAVDGRTGPLDVMPLAHAVPVMALAAAIGVPQEQEAVVADLVARLCQALAPRLDPGPTDPADGDQAAGELTEMLTALGPWDDEQVGAAAGLLFQAREATAALIASTLLGHGQGDAAASIDAALRASAPVQCTRRTAAEDVWIGGASIPRGAPVWVVLAAAEQGPPLPPATFGSGPHACPGYAHATALARGVLLALDEAGWELVPDQMVVYESRPNLRLPAAVLLHRA